MKLVNQRKIGRRPLSGLDGTSTIAPFLLTENDESAEGPPTKAKDLAEKKAIKGIEIHMSKQPERAGSR